MSEKRRDEVKHLHELEQEGLKRAEDRDGKTKGDSVWFANVQDSLNEIVLPYFEKMGERDWREFAHMLSNASYYGGKDAKACEYADERRSTCPTSNSTFDYLRDTDSHYRDLSNRPPPVTSRCTHLVAANTASTYRLNHALNDVTACLHRTLEHFEESARSWHKEGKCMWRE